MDWFLNGAQVSVLDRAGWLCTLGSLTLLEAEDAAWLTKEDIYSVKWLPADLLLIRQIIAAN